VWRVPQVGALCVDTKLQRKFKQPLRHFVLLWQVTLLQPPLLLLLWVLELLLLQLGVLQEEAKGAQE
jgi:hypothetical protein